MTEDLLILSNYAKVTYRIKWAYFAACMHSLGYRYLYEFFTHMMTNEGIRKFYFAHYGEEKAHKRLTKMRRFHADMLEVDIIDQRLETLYKKFYTLGDPATREKKLHEVIKALAAASQHYALRLTPIMDVILYDTILLCEKTDFKNNFFSLQHANLARQDALNYRSDEVVR